MTTRFLLAAFVLGTASVQTSVAMPTAQFTVRILDQMQGYDAWDMNDRGDVVGWRDDNAGHYNAYLYANGQHQSLATTFGGLWSAASGINNVGDVSGWYQVVGSGDHRAVLYRNGAVTVLPTGPFNSMVAIRINEQGDIVGNASVAGDVRERGFLYRNGTTMDVGTLGGHTRALAINDHGVVAGYSSVNGKDDVFRYENGQMTDLGTLGTGSYVTGINNSGQIVGYYNTSGGPHKPLFFDGAGMIDLGTLGGNRAEANAINDQSWIVGQSAVTVPSTYGEHAFLYRSGAMYDLNALIDPALGLELYNAVAVNNSGQILAEAAGFRTVLLTPVPEPATFGLVAVAAFSCLIAGAMRRRKTA